MPHALAETITQSPTESEAAAAIRADALRAEAWAGEPFLQADEDPDVVLAPGTARRRALDDALAEIDAGRNEPSPEWRVRYALMLGLERVLSEKPPHLASGTELRRHQVDALAGMLTELIAADQKSRERQRERQRRRRRRAPDEDDEAEDELGARRRGRRRGRGAAAGRARTPAPSAATASATRRRPGKTIAAAGFVEAARTEGVLILTHRRLLVDQFRRELTEHGYGDRASPTRSSRAHTPPRPSNPITIQTYAWFARHVDEIARDAYQLVICDEAHTALGEKTSAAIRTPQRADLHRHDRDRGADREAGLRRLPGLGRRPAARRRRAPRADRAAALPARAAGRGDQPGADRRRRLRGARARRRRSTTRR